MTETECQRFFALSKRVPKDVKRYCGICRQHGVLLETRGHTCTYKDCNCNKCQLVRTRRQIMSQQIRLRRAQDKRFQRTNEPQKADVVPIKLVNDEMASMIATSASGSQTIGPASSDELLTDARNMCYFCQKCKNHEILVWKKQHKRQCPFTSCTCEKCELIETRRRLDQHMKKRKAALKAAIESGMSPESFEEFAPSPKFSDASTPPINITSPPASNEALKIEDAFLQQKPMFAIPQPQQSVSPPESLNQFPSFVPTVQPAVSTPSFNTEGGAFSPPLPAPMPLSVQASLPQISLAAPVHLNTQPTLTDQLTLSTFATQPNLIHPSADLIQMIQKAISPPLLSSAGSPPLQFLPSVNFLPPMSIADLGQAALSQFSAFPSISYRELEHLLMLKHQQKLNFS